MNVPSYEMCRDLNYRKERGKYGDDFRFMLRSEFRNSLCHQYFPYNRQTARALLKDKHVMFIGDSLIRAMYKDMVSLITSGDICTVNQLRVSSEDTFLGDRHIDFLKLEANRVFRQAREFSSNRQLIQYYFTNRAMREDLEKTCMMIEATDERPDVVVINSAIWDVSRFPGRFTQSWHSRDMDDLLEEINVVDEYFNRIAMFCRRMRVLLPPSSTVIWVLMPPPGTPETTNGFIALNQLTFNEIRVRLLEANARAAQIVREAGFDVLDLSFHFRLSNFQAFRIKDGVHFNTIATRFMNQLLLGHLTTAWHLTDLVNRKWPLTTKNQTNIELLHCATEFLEKCDNGKHNNEILHQNLRAMSLDQCEITSSPGTSENPNNLESLDHLLRVLLFFGKFYERSQQDASVHERAFAGSLPYELSRFSHKDLENISVMIKNACENWKGRTVGLRVATSQKRIHEGVKKPALLPNPHNGPTPGHFINGNNPYRIADASPPSSSQYRKRRRFSGSRHEYR
ncbi:PC-esterase domain-containing protein 1B [Caenorhabditis elegans]|uniref:PC-esterase domain-containing protein 1B n=1 Tax=Caenorhabditis elegans TaxID=6239 RepID=P90793_CAEEL|nr:PC-esterase domain-containing protein 1B [Caenorhabditis elegans]CAA98120.3 PC-esterase domain-containing protein 1B [Caenorhabditis elegans]|eukprot:NP_492123.2 Uncharacterized protein CELE_D2030.8 [Caenorhabditis elegans]